MIGVWICTKPLFWRKTLNKTKTLAFALYHVKTKPLSWVSHLKIRMYSCRGLTPYPQQRAEGICSTPQVRKLANVLQAVSLFNFKRKILKGKKEAILTGVFSNSNIHFITHLWGVVCSYHRITFSNYVNLVCFKFHRLLLMWTFLKNTWNFNSTAKCKQP